MSGQNETSGPGRKKAVRKGMFYKDLKNMMYGFGDVKNPSADAINVLEDMVIDFISESCLQATKISNSRIKLTSEDSTRSLNARSKVTLEDFKFVLRKDIKKLARVDALLVMDAAIQKARQVFDESELAAIPDDEAGA